ncbi:MAG: GH3 auxin-responsive promoter family protein [Alphaproteobacteria bacterium]|nr:GH3 auxin-responsive promoter family protein [Alphaproteobacteria bacterium]
MPPAARQERLLLRLVERAAATRFGRAHGFGRLRGVADFQRAVPLRRYEEFWREWWQPAFPVLRGATWPDAVPFLALSSGTTSGVTKHIPLTMEMLAANRRAGQDTLLFHFLARPESRVLGGRSFMLGGSTSLEVLAPGIRAGDLSGIAAATLPWWAAPLVFPGRDLALLSDWEEKLERMARASLDMDIRVLTGTPSWLLILLERVKALRQARGEDPARPYPGMQLLIHGGVSFAPYRQRFLDLLSVPAPDLREVYAASEGFIAVADRGSGEGMRLCLDHGVFFEFVPVAELGAAQPTRHWVATVETGIDYALVLSSCAGLWSYVIGDTVRLVDRDPPRLLVTGRTSYSLSAFGEHLIAEEAEGAVLAAAAAIGAAVDDWAMGASFPTASEPRGFHVVVAELAGGVPGPDVLARFADVLDRDLAARNADYAAHRAGGTGLLAPSLLAVPPGSFARWMKRRGKLGGQHKVPRLISDPALFADLLAFMRDAESRG